MQKFTPGPWRTNPAEKTEIIADDEAMVICRVPASLLMKAAPANARLISAAPELYEALKELAAAYDNYDGGSISEKRIQAAVDGAESALAKATGA